MNEQTYIDSGVRAEATPFYVSSDVACSRIAESLDTPDNDYKLILMLRDPTDRAWSEYKMQMRRLDDQDAFLSDIQKHSDNLLTCFSTYMLSTVMATDKKKRKSGFLACVHPDITSTENSARFKKLEAELWRLINKFRVKSDKVGAIQKSKECWVANKSSSDEGFTAALDTVAMRDVTEEDDIEDLLADKVPGGTAFRVGCLGPKFLERLKEPEEAFEDDIAEWNECLETYRDSVPDLLTEDGVVDISKASIEQLTNLVKLCYAAPLKGIQRHFVYRSMFAPQIRRCIEGGIEEDKVYIVDDEDFKDNPSKVMDEIHEFVGVKPFTYDMAGNNEDIERVFNEAFPKFQLITGWRLDGKGLEMPAELKKRVQEVRKKRGKVRRGTNQ